MKHPIGLSIHNLQKKYGDARALELARELGADAVDFNIANAPAWDFRQADSVYAKSEEEIVEYFTALRRRADELGLVISQTHGRLRGYTLDADNNLAVLKNARLDCLATKALGEYYTALDYVVTLELPVCDEAKAMIADLKIVFI